MLVVFFFPDPIRHIHTHGTQALAQRKSSQKQERKNVKRKWARQSQNRKVSSLILELVTFVACGGETAFIISYCYIFETQFSQSYDSGHAPDIQSVLRHFRKNFIDQCHTIRWQKEKQIHSAEISSECRILMWMLFICSAFFFYFKFTHLVRFVLQNYLLCFCLQIKWHFIVAVLFFTQFRCIMKMFSHSIDNPLQYLMCNADACLVCSQCNHFHLFCHEKSHFRTSFNVHLARMNVDAKSNVT